MDITGITRLQDGKEVDQFVVGHSDHNYWYTGRPPLTHGCKECWAAYFFGDWVQAGAKPEKIDALESAIMHAKEKIEKGEWDFEPQFEMKIEHEE